jgi:hypothetical protein
MNSHSLALIGILLTVTVNSGYAGKADSRHPWKVGEPVVTYWAGPPMTDATASQMAEGGWNLVWCTEKELEVAGRHGLRAQLQDPLLNPASLDNPQQSTNLDALISRVKTNPVLYSYFITDEPNATNFPGLGKLVGYLRKKDPAHLAYINLFPTYASNEQLGNAGQTVSAYKSHLSEYVERVKPGLISYDHYQFTTKGDTADYFLNLALVRNQAAAAGVPFLNIVQACTWATSMRVPKVDEVRYLVYTTLGYGAQGISYYVYRCAGHTGGFANEDGAPTALYQGVKTLNHEFVAIARQLQPLRWIGVYHLGMQPPGTEPPPKELAWRIEPPVAGMAYHPPSPVKGIMLACFGKSVRNPTHTLVVNLDYEAPARLEVQGRQQVEVFDTATSEWMPTGDRIAQLSLAPGGGKLLRERR